MVRPSIEVEFRAMALAICELLWIRIMLNDLMVEGSGLMKLYYNNKSTISIAYDPVQHIRTKHMELDRHFIKKNIDTHYRSSCNIREPTDRCFNQRFDHFKVSGHH